MKGEMSAGELLAAMGMKDREHFRAGVLRPALQAKVVEMTEPDKPNSSKQRYRLTPTGKALCTENIN
jgi:ATP-dependent DNA helicase RecG